MYEYTFTVDTELYGECTYEGVFTGTYEAMVSYAANHGLVKFLEITLI